LTIGDVLWRGLFKLMHAIVPNGGYRFPTEFKPFGKRVHSQMEEDGIIEHIFTIVPPASRYFVEIGLSPPQNYVPDPKTILQQIKDANAAVNDTETVLPQSPAWSSFADPDEGKLEGNTVWLREKGWRGLMLDAGDYGPEFDLKAEFIEPMNINSILRKYNVPRDCDLISIDVDGQDFWIWMAVDWRPVLFILEYNANHIGIDNCITVPYDPKFRWDGSTWYGASLGALVKCGNNKGYTLVYTNGVNAFFVRTDLIANAEDFDPAKIAVWGQQHNPDPLGRPYVHV
jgi:hypothetical protein